MVSRIARGRLDVDKDFGVASSLVQAGKGRNARESAVMSKLFLGALLTVGLAASAQAAMTVPPVERSPAVTLVAEGCGPGFWCGPGGHCHPFAMNRLSKDLN